MYIPMVAAPGEAGLDGLGGRWVESGVAADTLRDITTQAAIISTFTVYNLYANAQRKTTTEALAPSPATKPMVTVVTKNSTYKPL